MRILPALGMALLAGGCVDTDSQGMLGTIYGGAEAVLNRNAPSEGITLSDAELLALPVNVLVVRDGDGGEAGFALNAVNRDTITWRSNDGVTVQTRRGQLVGTAGYGNDLASADVPDFGDGTGRAVRDHYYLGSDELIHRRRFFCDFAQAGAETVAVAGIDYATLRVDETCETEAGLRVQNIYWVDAQGVMRQSRQFASPEIGYLSLQDVHTGRR